MTQQTPRRQTSRNSKSNDDTRDANANSTANGTNNANNSNVIDSSARTANGRIAKPTRRTRGFQRIDQRLPASPPLQNKPLTGMGTSIMGTIRARTRDALEILFLPSPRVLNTECNADMLNRVCALRVAPKSTPSTGNGYTATDQVVPSGTPASAALCACGANIWREEGVSAEDMIQTAGELASSIATLYSRVVDPKEGTVDYGALLHPENIRGYITSARKLRYFDPTMLNPAERKAFFLNVYNALMIHGIAVLRKPKSLFERKQLFNTAAYNIGGRVYTLDIIEHGVLRCNRPSNGPFAQNPLRERDARVQCTLPEPLDPRIHFALNCGARSCPPVRYYDAAAVEAALETATKAFLLGVELDVERRTVTLSKIFMWYKHDFDANGNTMAVLNWIRTYLSPDARDKLDAITQHGTPKILYSDYDWTINDSSL